MKVKDLGEFGLIDRIAARAHTGPGVLLGIGDDCAGLAPTPGTVTLITSDMLLEGVHFDLSFTDPRTLGRKSLAVNLSDVASMGGVPRQFLLGIALPKEASLEFMDPFVFGMLEMAERYGAVLVGGDTCSSKGGVAISITALGEQIPGRILKRSGAAAGDLVFVTGTVGDAAAGLAQLRRGERSGRLVQRQLDPTPRVEAGVALAEGGVVSAMIDVSDGVLADLGHICDLSAVGARLELSRLPLSGEYRAFCGDDPYSLALSGGEDYELLFTAPSAHEREVLAIVEGVGLSCTVIGEIVEGKGIELVGPGGEPYAVSGKGFDHFG
ncbi:thiamine-phosphate kinase [Geomonas sp. RF6]|uniref:thiamine-phosphate kinase n=1 Tax=Geomonas sp. RF6 TaxID=2897342 RepID=UPI001E46502B|nr:thiamine-phosphate kinase [Geomonas sp. RF6]UFS71583.1 thiamine-phosphate kinase [Geomonas sp. RF6]